MATGVTAGMQASKDAIAMVRAYLAPDEAETSRILAETPNLSALASNLCFIAQKTIATLDDELREHFFTMVLRDMQDNALDVHLMPDGYTGR